MSAYLIDLHVCFDLPVAICWISIFTDFFNVMESCPDVTNAYQRVAALGQEQSAELNRPDQR